MRGVPRRGVDFGVHAVRQQSFAHFPERNMDEVSDDFLAVETRMNPQSRNGVRRLGDPTPDSGTQQALPRLWQSALPRECLPVAFERAVFPFLPTALACLQK